jgi:hypothetical protein
MADFKVDPKFLTAPVNIHVEGNSPGAGQVLANTAPGAAPIIVGTAEISVSETGAPAGVPSAVTFETVKFSAGTTAKIAILPNAAGLAGEITDGIDIADQITPALTFPPAPGAHYAFLRWSYDIAAAASGSVALGGGVSVSFGADLGRGGVFALVRQIADQDAAGNTLGCADMLTDLVASWRLPKQVTDVDSIPPGTWIVAEANGHANWNAGIQYGYNFNWIRKVTAGTLAGDIGLKLQTGLAATLSMGISGKHSIVVGRGTGDSASRIFLRLYRLKVRNWSAGFSASLNVTGVNNNFLPANFDDLLAGVLGTDGNRIVKALKDVDSWTDPTQPLLGPLGKVTGDYLRSFFRDITGKDLDTELDQVKTTVQTALEKWDSLPQETTKLLWSKLPDADAIAKIASLAGEIGNANAGTLQNLLADKLGDAALLGSPAGQWLESLAANDLFTALQKDADLATIQSYAKKVQDLLDGSDVQSLLQKLHDAISSRLDLTAFKNITDQLSVDNLDQWLVGKLSTFLGEQPGVKAALDKLTALRDQIHKLAGMRQTFYAKALEALQKTYSLSFTANYQSASTSDALLDAEFDFAVDAADAAACLGSALNGELEPLLGGAHPSLTLHQGVLTHGIRRQSTVELTLPYFDQKTIHINDVLGSITAIDHGEGRLLAVTGSDEVTEITNQRTKRDSTLSLAMNLTAAGATGLTFHDSPTATGSYSLVDQFQRKPESQFLTEYQQVIDLYFPTEFQAPAGSLQQYADELAANTGDLGSGTISLQVALPPDVVLAWLNAKDHGDATDPIYKRIATRVLAKYRQYLCRQYFGDVSNYGNVGAPSPAFTLLAYASVPLQFNVAIGDGEGNFKVVRDDASPHLHWNEAHDANLVNAMLTSDKVDTKALLGLHLGPIHDFLVSIGHPEADFYAPDQAEKIANEAATHWAIGSLFDVETGIVLDIREACVNIAQFLNSAGGETDVFDAFEAFASGLTRSFSSDLRNLWAGKSDTLLLPLGPMLMQEAAAEFDAAIATLQPGAMLTVEGSNLKAPQRMVRLLPVPQAAAAKEP